jgi:hypothetical protein
MTKLHSDLYADISGEIARLFDRQEDPRWNSRLAEETHVVHRQGALDRPFSALIYCEGVRCVYQVWYNEDWKRREIAHFLSDRIAANTEHIRLVFNCIRFATTDEDGRLDGLWEKAARVPDEECLAGHLVMQPICGYVVNRASIEFVRFEMAAEPASYYLVGIEHPLILPYQHHAHQLRFDLLDLHEGPPNTLRVTRSDTNEMLAVLTATVRRTLTKGAYDRQIRERGYIWRDGESG